MKSRGKETVSGGEFDEGKMKWKGKGGKAGRGEAMTD